MREPLSGHDLVGQPNKISLGATFGRIRDPQEFPFTSEGRAIWTRQVVVRVGVLGWLQESVLVINKSRRTDLDERRPRHEREEAGTASEKSNKVVETIDAERIVAPRR